jgi:hypothetical protein
MLALAVVALCATVETIMRDTPCEFREPYIPQNYRSVRERLGYEIWDSVEVSTIIAQGVGLGGQQDVSKLGPKVAVYAEQS